jgi:hypothetical protein
MLQVTFLLGRPTKLSMMAFLDGLTRRKLLGAHGSNLRIFRRERQLTSYPGPAGQFVMAGAKTQIPVRIKPQLVSLVTKPLADGAWCWEIKIEGYKYIVESH